VNITGLSVHKPKILECHALEEAKALYPVVRQLRRRLTIVEFLDRFQKAKHGGYRLFYAKVGDSIAGAIGVRTLDDLRWGHHLYIDDLIVDERVQGNGIGSALLLFAERFAMSEKCHSIRLAAGISRARAHEFYEQLSYRKVSAMFALELK